MPRNTLTDAEIRAALTATYYGMEGWGLSKDLM